MNKQFIIAERKEFDDDERTVVGYGSKPCMDRDKELITTNAWKLENFKRNPVLMLCHNYDNPPVGKVLWVKTDNNGLKFKAKFASTPRGQEVYQLYKEGVMNAFSVGFAPNAGGVVDNPVEPKYKGVKRLFTDVELLEISCVPIPSNNQSLVEFVKAGKVITKGLKEELDAIVEIIEKEADTIEIADTEDIETKAIEIPEVVVADAVEASDENIETKSEEEIVVKVETTDNYVHVPAPDQEGKHVDHKIRTVELSKKEGIKGQYCIDDKIMIAYLFETDKDWDEKKAKEWVEEHSKSFSAEIKDEDEIVITKDGQIWDAFEDVVETKAMAPSGDEDMVAFMDRCMSDETMNSDNPDEGDRKAACQMKWDEINKPDEKKEVTDIETKENDGDDIKTFINAVTLLKEEFETLKKCMIASPSPTADIPASVTKTADAQGNPSLYDLTAAINNALNDPKNAVLVKGDDTDCYCNVIDIYSTEFPSGHVVYGCYCGCECEYKQIDYSFDTAERQASLTGNPVDVLQSWVVDRYGTQEDMFEMKNKEEILTKEGRVLSEQNRQMMTDCVTQLTEAIQALKELVTATDKTPKVAQTVEELFMRDNKEIETKDFIEIEDSIVETKSVEDFLEIEEDDGLMDIDEDVLKAAIESALTKTFKIDVRGAVTETVARMKGKVVA